MINLLGVAGSGKSTQGRSLAEYLHCPWVSTGEILRTNLTGSLREEMLHGKIIDDTTTLGLLGAKLKAEGADKHECVVDGTPRTLAQAGWMADQASHGGIMMTGVVHLTMDQAAAKERLLKRGRPDDTEMAITERFEEYERAVLPILAYLKQQGVGVYDVDADGSVEEVAERIRKALGVEK